MKKIIYYYQTFSGLNSIINYDGSIVTHIHLSSIHFGNDNNNKPYIHLNDLDPLDPSFDKVWQQLKFLKKKKIKVILMIGGAGGGFSSLFSDFITYYTLLKNLILKKIDIIDGVDLDVEENVGLKNITRLINKIKLDFGHNFIVSMAPIQSALQTDSIGLGGFIYKDLYKSVGNFIDYFNVQFYEEYNFESYKQILDNGYPIEKIIMGSISSQNFKNNLNEIQKITKNYSNFAGVFNWEYFDAPPNPNNPLIWAIIINSYF